MPESHAKPTERRGAIADAKHGRREPAHLANGNRRAADAAHPIQPDLALGGYPTNKVLIRQGRAALSVGDTAEQCEGWNRLAKPGDAPDPRLVSTLARLKTSG